VLSSLLYRPKQENVCIYVSQDGSFSFWVTVSCILQFSIPFVSGAVMLYLLIDPEEGDIVSPKRLAMSEPRNLYFSYCSLALLEFLVSVRKCCQVSVPSDAAC
jgi:hypothetical protein